MNIESISVPINAYYDTPTLHGVRLMQQRLHLRSDGVVGPHTFAALVKKEPVPLPHDVVVALEGGVRTDSVGQGLCAGRADLVACKTEGSEARGRDTKVLWVGRAAQPAGTAEVKLRDCCVSSQSGGTVTRSLSFTKRMASCATSATSASCLPGGT